MEAPFVLLPQAQLQSETFPPHLSDWTALVFTAPYTQSLPSPSVRRRWKRGSVHNGFSTTPCFLLIFLHCWLLLSFYSAPAGVPAQPYLQVAIPLAESLPQYGSAMGCSLLRGGWPTGCSPHLSMGCPQVRVPSGVHILALTWLTCSPQSVQECPCSSVQPPQEAVPLRA